MPRVVRNFFIETNVDGSKTSIRTGPRNKNGGFSQKIYIREHGDISDTCLTINGIVYENELKIDVSIRKAISSTVEVKSFPDGFRVISKR